MLSFLDMKTRIYTIIIFFILIIRAPIAYSQENTILQVDSLSLRNNYLNEMQSINVLKHKPIEVSEDLVRSVLDKQAPFAVYKDNYMVTGIPLNKSVTRKTADAFFQFSIRHRVTRSVFPFNSFLYITYSQKSFWDIYDENKKPTGRTMKRNDWCLKDGEYHLTVLGVVGRPDGTFLITKRVMTKAWAPGWWEVSGGAAQAGEESCEAVLREVKEETGLDVRNAEGGYLFTYKRENPGEGDNYFVDVYRFVMDIDESDLHLQTEETDGYMFATVDEIKAFAAEGKFLHYDSIKKAFEM